MSVKYRADSSGVAQVLSSGGAQAVVSSAVGKVADYAEGMSVSGEARYTRKCSVYGDRVVGLVGTTDRISRDSNAKHKSLAKAIRSVRV